MILALSTLALAQDFDAQLFRPSVDSRATIWTDDVGDADGISLRALAGYADNPLVFDNDDGSSHVVVGSLTQVHLAASASVGRFRLGAQAPVTVYAAGTGVDGPAGMGDVSVHGRVRLIDHLAVSGALIAPTNTLDAPLGAPGFGGEVGLIGDVDVGRALVAANVGVRLGRESELGNETWNDPLYGRLGAGLPLTDAVGVSMDLTATWDPGIPAHAEALAGAWWTVTDRWTLRGGIGTGLARGPGTPTARGVVGLSYDLSRAEPVVVEPEPIPHEGWILLDVVDPDGNPVAAEWWTTGLENPTPVEPGNEFLVEPGEHRIEIRAKGYGATVLTTTVVPGQTQELSVMMEPARVEVVGDRVEIREKVFFELGSAEIQAQSHSLLDEVAMVLEDHPEILVLRIEGHTDAQGGELSNLELSKARANAVRDHLVGAGVADERLTAAGYGETRPLVEGEGEEAWSQNRRVEFHIEERAEE